MKVPWAKPYIGKEELNEVVDSMKSGWITMGPKVARFEDEVGKYVGVKHAIAVNSGTAALDVALKAIGIRPGDEVVIPAMTYIATANAILYQGATPVLADIESVTYNINPGDVISKITNQTKCIISIDYSGQCARYDTLERICSCYKLFLVVDGAESLGAKHKGREACSFGNISTTSFHAAKLITSVEGGMVFTNDDKLAGKARIIRNQGEDQKYHHILLGHNYRMSDLHAAVGLAQFKRIKDVLNKRYQLAQHYTKGLRGYSIGLPFTSYYNKHAWFMYPITVSNRDQVVESLRGKGIDTRVAWPIPIHKQPLYQHLFKDSNHQVAEVLAESVLSLPMYYEMTREEQDYVIKHLREAVSV